MKRTFVSRQTFYFQTLNFVIQSPPMTLVPHLTELLPADAERARDALEQAMTLAEAEQRAKEFLEQREKELVEFCPMV